MVGGEGSDVDPWVKRVLHPKPLQALTYKTSGLVVAMEMSPVPVASMSYAGAPADVTRVLVYVVTSANLIIADAEEVRWIRIPKATIL